MRERILSVYRGDHPDKIPFMLDLSHWFYHRNRMSWDLSRSYDKPEKELIDYHKRMGVGFYMPNLASFYDTLYPSDIKITVRKNFDGSEIRWRISTPSGQIERIRVWEESNYAWGIPEWGVKDREGLMILAEALSHRKYCSDWKKYDEWNSYVGDAGLVYLSVGYSGMGQLLNYWMGIEGAFYAICDWPETLREVVDRINQNNLELIDLLVQSPAEVIIMGDNFSSDIQPPAFFEEWSKSYYAEAIRRLHAAGKYVAVHIDGRLKGSLKMFAEIGADCADAVTPRPTGDLSPVECREDAGPEMILSGGVPPCLWLQGVDDEAFRKAVTDWLELAKTNPRLIANAGDQVPPHALESRIIMMRKIVEEYA
ncbi:MAG: hypothetical protein JW808_06155 [Victivallales bacterium]|nr:hypothetical protein [Victivallales bacterium]